MQTTNLSDDELDALCTFQILSQTIIDVIWPKLFGDHIDQLIKNQKLTEEFIISSDLFRTHRANIVTYQDLSPALVLKMYSPKDYLLFAKNTQLPNEINRKYFSECESIQGFMFHPHNKIEEELLAEFAENIEWGHLFDFGLCVSEDFLTRFRHKLNWRQVSQTQQMSDDFLATFIMHIDWADFFSHNPFITESTIQRFCNYHFGGQLLSNRAIPSSVKLTMNFTNIPEGKLEDKLGYSFETAKEILSTKPQPEDFWRWAIINDSTTRQLISSAQNLINFSEIVRWQHLSHETLYQILAQCPELRSDIINYQKLSTESLRFLFSQAQTDEEKRQVIEKQVWAAHERITSEMIPAAIIDQMLDAAEDDKARHRIFIQCVKNQALHEHQIERHFLLFFYNILYPSVLKDLVRYQQLSANFLEKYQHLFRHSSLICDVFRWQNLPFELVLKFFNPLNSDHFVIFDSIILAKETKDKLFQFYNL